jgi:hypothetical protein
MIDRELPDDVEMQGASTGMRFRMISSTGPGSLNLADCFRTADHPLQKPASGKSRAEQNLHV